MTSLLLVLGTLTQGQLPCQSVCAVRMTLTAGAVRANQQPRLFLQYPQQLGFNPCNCCCATQHAWWSAEALRVCRLMAAARNSDR